MTVKVALSWTDDADRTLDLPAYETAQAAGVDLRANFSKADRAEGLCLKPGARALVPTGLRMALPEGYEAQIRPRSGLALKDGISLVNTPGTIDADYRGPLGIIVINHGDREFQISHGMRIAQMVIAPVSQAEFQLVDDLDATVRGDGGFGSTGRG